jgi:hypothetical protein
MAERRATVLLFFGHSDENKFPHFTSHKPGILDSLHNQQAGAARNSPQRDLPTE